jgi:hypothetical protein
MAGINHGIRPLEEAAKTSPWITGVPLGLARFIGYAIGLSLFVAWGRYRKAPIPARGSTL